MKTIYVTGDYNAAYEAGYQSYFAGGTYAHCPYDVSDSNASYWVQGFDDAKAKAANFEGMVEVDGEEFASYSKVNL